MTHNILKSVLSGIPNFSVRAAAHAKEMRDWRAQMKLAAEHKGNDSIPMAERYVERPRPREAPLIEAAVNENDEVDFAIVDDGPTPAQALAFKKAAIAREVERAEGEAIDVVMPPGKMRLTGFRRTDVTASDVAILNAAQKNIDAELQKFLDLETKRLGMANKPKPGIISAVVKAVAGPSEADLADEAALKAIEQESADQDRRVLQLRSEFTDRPGLLVKMRSPKDHEFMVDYDARSAKVEAIRRQAAQMLADVADLTAETIDAWKMTPFDK